jgi:hypothetical protein
LPEITTDESAEAQIERLEDQPLEESKRKEQKQEARFLKANAEEYLKRAVMSMQNDLLPLSERLPMALKHIDALDRMMTGVFPHLEKYMASDPLKELEQSNIDLAQATPEDKGFQPKTLGGTLEQRMRIGVSAAQILNLRQSACRQIVQMNAQIIMNVTINEKSDQQNEPSIVEAEDYDVAEDFSDLST